MKKTKACTIALLGQPNSGKSTLFNKLTGSRQHVGNWPGKTVEKKEGSFTQKETMYTLMDLPGSYSLAANSAEEIITREYIAEGNTDLVCILADASQLERSLYMLADFAGIEIPSILLLNMMDVAESQGKIVDTDKISNRLGIPVLPFTASDHKAYETFYSLLDTWESCSDFIKTNTLYSLYKQMPNHLFDKVCQFIPKEGIGRYSQAWLGAKIIEGDQPALQNVISILPDVKKQALQNIAENIQKGSLLTGECKFQWIDQILGDAVIKSEKQKESLNSFDKIALDSVWGKYIAVLIILFGLAGSMLPSIPFLSLGAFLPKILGVPLTNVMKYIGCSEFIISLICGPLLHGISLTVSMIGFIFGITFVFGIIEETGYMARISYVFDPIMVKLGLQGKAVMPFLVSLGCTTGGVAGTRVIDSWGQRVLTTALIWAVPCGATFAVVPTLAVLFFGWGAPFIMLGIFAVMVAHIFITAKIFGRTLAPMKERTGLIMEIPPYHNPHWRNLISHVCRQTGSVCIRAFKVILLMSMAFWILSYSRDNQIQSSLLYSIGTFIEPVTRIFGLSWKTFMAFVSSSINKEAVFGVLSALYAESGGFFDSAVGISSASANFEQAVAGSVSKPEALALLFAITFNTPCVMALVSTYEEIRSLKWTVKIAAYYTIMALLLSLIMYRVGIFIFWR